MRGHFFIVWLMVFVLLVRSNVIVVIMVVYGYYGGLMVIVIASGHARHLAGDLEGALTHYKAAAAVDACPLGVAAPPALTAAACVSLVQLQQGTLGRTQCVSHPLVTWSLTDSLPIIYAGRVGDAMDTLRAAGVWDGVADSLPAMPRCVAT